MDGEMSTPPRDRIFGLGFDRIDMGGALRRLAGRSPDLPFAFVVTPNVDHVLKADTDPALGLLLDRSWLCLNDSRILRAAARRLGLELPLVPGSTLTAELFDTVIRPEEPITIIGCTAETITRLAQRYGLAAVAHHWPAFGFLDRPAEVEACVAFIRANPARFTFLAVGSPRQEILADRVAAAGGATGIGLCIGASLNFLAGETKRAPLWMQNMSLEWLYRLVTEPRRLWRRYLLGAVPFLRLLQRERAAARAGGAASSGRT